MKNFIAVLILAALIGCETNSVAPIVAENTQALKPVVQLDLVAPANNADTLSNPVRFIWTRVIGASTYKLYWSGVYQMVSESRSGVKTVAEQICTTCTYRTTVISGFGQNPGVTRFWKVVALDSSGQTLLVSQIYKFTMK